MPMHKFALVACARWEETQIQEWVEYHKSIGFSHVYLYSNDDDPTALFRAIASYTRGPDPFITFRHWPVVGEQAQIYLDFMQNFKCQTEWYSFLDIDEFFVLKDVNNIGIFMQEYEDRVDCLYFNSVIYGSCGRLQREDVSTLTTYIRHACHPNATTKILCRASSLDVDAIQRNSGIGKFWHFLDNYELPGIRCSDVLHASTEGYSADFPASAAPFIEREGFSETILARAYIAHFRFKSEEDFLRRWRRGGFPNSYEWLRIYELGVHKGIFEKNNMIYDTYLADYWHRHTMAHRVTSDWLAASHRAGALGIRA